MIIDCNQTLGKQFLFGFVPSFVELLLKIKSSLLFLIAVLKYFILQIICLNFMKILSSILLFFKNCPPELIKTLHFIF